MAYRSGSTAAYTTATTVVVSVPTGAAINDIAIVHIFVQHTGTTITGVPTGFTLNTSVNHVGSTRFWTHYQYWKRLTAADTGSYTFTLSASESTMATCGLYSGRLQSGSPYDVTTVTGTAPASTDTITNCPGTTITPVTAGSDLVWAAFPFNSCATGDMPPSFTQAAFDASSMIQAYRANQPASSTGSLTQTTPRADLWSVHLSALRPDASAPVAVAFAGTGSLTVTSTHTIGATVAFTGAGTLRLSPSVASSDTYSDTYSNTYGAASQTASVSMSGSGALGVAAVSTTIATVAVSGAGALAVAAVATTSAAVAFAGAGALGVTAVSTTSTAVALTGAGTLGVAPAATVQATVAVSGAGALSVAPLVTHLPTLPLAGGSTLTVTTSGSQTATVALTGAGTVGVTPAVTETASIALSGSGTLNISPLVSHPLVVALSGSGVLTISGGSMATLPAAVTFGTVKAWFGTGVNQAPDADGYPDLIAAVGTVTFSPSKTIATYTSASPAPLILAPKPVVATLDSNGYLTGTKAGEQLVRLIAGSWVVSFQLAGITLPSFNLTVAAGTTTDLADVIPVS